MIKAWKIDLTKNQHYFICIKLNRPNNFFSSWYHKIWNSWNQKKEEVFGRRLDLIWLQDCFLLISIYIEILIIIWRSNWLIVLLNQEQVVTILSSDNSTAFNKQSKKVIAHTISSLNIMMQSTMKLTKKHISGNGTLSTKCVKLLSSW